MKTCGNCSAVLVTQRSEFCVSCASALTLKEEFKSKWGCGVVKSLATDISLSAARQVRALRLHSLKVEEERTTPGGIKLTERQGDEGRSGPAIAAKVESPLKTEALLPSGSGRATQDEGGLDTESSESSEEEEAPSPIATKVPQGRSWSPDLKTGPPQAFPKSKGRAAEVGKDPTSPEEEPSSRQKEKPRNRSRRGEKTESESRKRSKDKKKHRSREPLDRKRRRREARLSPEVEKAGEPRGSKQAEREFLPERLYGLTCLRRKINPKPERRRNGGRNKRYLRWWPRGRGQPPKRDRSLGPLLHGRELHVVGHASPKSRGDHRIGVAPKFFHDYGCLGKFFGQQRGSSRGRRPRCRGKMPGHYAWRHHSPVFKHFQQEEGKDPSLWRSHRVWDSRRVCVPLQGANSCGSKGVPAGVCGSSGKAHAVRIAGPGGALTQEGPRREETRGERQQTKRSTQRKSCGFQGWQNQGTRGRRQLRRFEGQAGTAEGEEKKGYGSGPRQGRRGRWTQGWQEPPRKYTLCSSPATWAGESTTTDGLWLGWNGEAREGEESEDFARIGGAKRRYYWTLEEFDHQQERRKSAGTQCGAGSQASFSRERKPWRRWQEKEEEKEKEEKGQEGAAKEKEEKEEGQGRRRPIFFRVIFRIRRQLRGLSIRIGKFERGVRRSSTSTEETKRASPRSCAGVVASKGRRALGLGGGEPPGRPPLTGGNKNPDLLQFNCENRLEQHQQRWKRALSPVHVLGSLADGRSSPARGRNGRAVFRLAPGQHRWRLACGSKLGDTYSRTGERSRSSCHLGRTKTQQDAGKGEGPRRAPPRWLEEAELARMGRKLVLWRRMAEPERKRKARAAERKRKGEGRPMAEGKRQRQESAECLGGPRQRRGREDTKQRGLRNGPEKESRRPAGLGELGLEMWSSFLQADQTGKPDLLQRVPTRGKKFCEQILQGLRVDRPKRSLFPLPRFWESELKTELLNLGLTSPENGLGSDCVSRLQILCWCELCALFCNHLYDGNFHWAKTAATTPQRNLCEQIKLSVTRVLENDCKIVWEEDEVIGDMNKRNLSYTGEELSLPEQLTIAQIIPGLPPEEHGGKIPIEDWVSDRCKYYLESPSECLVEDVGQELPKLQAKVHVEAEEKLKLGKLLVERNICTWVKDSEVLRFRNQQVLNGMFGVEKSKKLEDGRSVLRLIMNLIPSNSIHRVISGRVHELPHITRWCSIVLEENEVMHVCQSDMTAAFYLFKIPEVWHRHLCFDLKAAGWQLGKSGEEAEMTFVLSCAVLPMGWSSAVGVMQFMAEEVLHRNGMPKDSQIRRTSPLPEWMVNSVDGAKHSGKMWWHVYLDNYASGEKVLDGKPQAGEWQHKVEGWWKEAGIVSSAEKSMRDEMEATELGAFLGGKGRWIGASAERLTKLIKTTLWLVGLRNIPRKMLQILMGRWIFVLQFRRAGMSNFTAVWDFISQKKRGEKVENEVREELVAACFGSLLFHTFLGARIDSEITCSDASNKGGAIAWSSDLSRAGQEFLASQEKRFRPKKVPVAVVSLFNGIGACFRCYDLAGAEVVGAIAADTHKPGNRVTSRRWPWVTLCEDVRELDRAKMEAILEEMKPHEQIHIWLGFPCVDLSSAKAFRRNLEGSQSSLVHEGKRIVEELKALYPNKGIKFVVENVASMDASARDAISAMWGVKPIRVDPSNQVPMSRPRFCWTDIEFPDVEGLWWTDKGSYWELEVDYDWPEPSQWLDPDAWQCDESTIYPTCMKSIPRDRPPPRPAGIERCSEGAIQRWRSHGFRFPPYQYKECYLLGPGNSSALRLLSITERERLMGLGTNHTEVCWSASKAKQNKQGYLDERLSLVGDSFACPSFMLVAAAAVFPWLEELDVRKLNQRLGLPPGASSNVAVKCPLNTELSYGQFETAQRTVHHMNTHLAARANHTGSDVRLVTGELMNPRQMARQSVNSSWWMWKQAFTVAWKIEQHINPLETRAIFLSLSWKARQNKLHGKRVFHLTDSYVSQSILSKGRTSSKLMSPIVQKTNALLLAAGAHLFVTHVDSADNPTDEGSRNFES